MEHAFCGKFSKQYLNPVEEVMSEVHLAVSAQQREEGGKKQNSVVVYHQELVLLSRRDPAFLPMSIVDSPSFSLVNIRMR